MERLYLQRVFLDNRLERLMQEGVIQKKDIALVSILVKSLLLKHPNSALKWVNCLYAALYSCEKKNFVTDSKYLSFVDWSDYKSICCSFVKESRCKDRCSKVLKAIKFNRLFKFELAYPENHIYINTSSKILNSLVKGVSTFLGRFTLYNMNLSHKQLMKVITASLQCQEITFRRCFILSGKLKCYPKGSSNLK
ncbi:unnamed protein product [Moneuplotes crassus]|uniref:Uncharacterized protein n=1 Tax=Euplotes crassus TaxID=5936 RepID=A0AAD2CYV7_EUPCR|nr:unnamed protein product [Moneuplotes crassus]